MDCRSFNVILRLTTVIFITFHHLVTQIQVLTEILMKSYNIAIFVAETLSPTVEKVSYYLHIVHLI